MGRAASFDSSLPARRPAARHQERNTDRKGTTMQLTVIRCDRCHTEATPDEAEAAKWQTHKSSFLDLNATTSDSLQESSQELCPSCVHAIKAAMSRSEPQRIPEVSLEDVEIQHIFDTLTANNWNKSKTASILKIERSTLDRKLKKHEIQRPGSADPKTTEGA